MTPKRKHRTDLSYNRTSASRLLNAAKSASGLTYTQIAAKAAEIGWEWTGTIPSIGPQTVSRLISGHTASPHITHIYLVCWVLGVAPATVLPYLRNNPDAVRVIRAAIHAGTSVWAWGQEYAKLPNTSVPRAMRGHGSPEFRRAVLAVLERYEAEHPYPPSPPAAPVPEPIPTPTPPVGETEGPTTAAEPPTEETAAPTVPDDGEVGHVLPAPGGPVNPTLLREPVHYLYNGIGLMIEETVKLLAVMGPSNVDHQRHISEIVYHLTMAMRRLTLASYPEAPPIVLLPPTGQRLEARDKTLALLQLCKQVVRHPEAITEGWLQSYASWDARHEPGDQERPFSGAMGDAYRQLIFLLGVHVALYQAFFGNPEPPVEAGPFDDLP